MRQYRCSVPGCKRKYSTPYTLKRHTQAYHLQIKRFACPVCDRLFAYKHTMIDHRARHRQLAKAALAEAPKLTDMLKFWKTTKTQSNLPIPAGESIHLANIEAARQGLQLLPPFAEEWEASAHFQSLTDTEMPSEV